MTLKLTGLVAATHTPLHPNGELNVDAVARQAEHLLANGVNSVFIGGTTGESHSLTVDERLALARRWSEVVRDVDLRLVVHVGANCLADAKVLAAQAQELGAAAISALAPSYFKPRDVEALVACCAEVAAAAPGLPFYYYDIPSMTGVQLSTPRFLDLAAPRIPTLAGIKISHGDLVAYQQCLNAQGGRFDLPWGIDEALLAALALGATGGVGSTYNFAAPLYLRIIAAFAAGDFALARAEQLRSVQLVELLAGFGFMGAAKTLMGFLGVDVGPARAPNANLTPEQVGELRTGLERLGYFDWIRP